MGGGEAVRGGCRGRVGEDSPAAHGSDECACALPDLCRGEQDESDEGGMRHDGRQKSAQSLYTRTTLLTRARRLA